MASLKYADVGKYPEFQGKPDYPRYLHGGYRYLPETKDDSPIRSIKCLFYNDFPVTEFIEVIW